MRYNLGKLNFELSDIRSFFSFIKDNIKVDKPLVFGLIIISLFGLFILYSAVSGDSDVWRSQIFRILIAIFAMLFVAQIPSDVLLRWAPWIYLISLVILSLVLFQGEIGQGAQRWLDIGIRFQPSEIMKIAVPMMVAWYLHDKVLPPNLWQLLIILSMVFIPTYLIAKQPDLGTSLLIASSGLLVIFLSGISIKSIISMMLLAIPGSIFLWKNMYEFQRQRVIMLFNPESDALGSGYNIIQSKIAIGSGGVFGKGWLNGTQSQLEFLPEKNTDFIFAVIGEELGLLGALSLLFLYILVIGRGIYIAAQARDTFSRLLAGSISITFFIYVFVNTAMVTGLIPVVGVPLPLISYGGSSMVSLMIGFGILMSIQSHQKLIVQK